MLLTRSGIFDVKKSERSNQHEKRHREQRQSHPLPPSFTLHLRDLFHKGVARFCSTNRNPQAHFAPATHFIGTKKPMSSDFKPRLWTPPSSVPFFPTL
jgi:hypothetical protein